MLVTILNPTTGASTISGPVAVTVNQTFTAIAVSGPAAGVAGGTLLFSGLSRDQFGNPLAVQPLLSWSASGGRVNSSGMLSAGSVNGAFQVSATASYKTGSASYTLSGGTDAAATGGGSGGCGGGAGLLIGISLLLGLRSSRNPPLNSRRRASA